MFRLHSERSELIFLRGLWWRPWCGGGGRDGESEREIEKERSSDLSVALSPLSRLFFVSPSLLSLMAVVAGVVCVCVVLFVKEAYRLLLQPPLQTLRCKRFFIGCLRMGKHKEGADPALILFVREVFDHLPKLVVGLTFHLRQVRLDEEINLQF